MGAHQLRLDVDGAATGTDGKSGTLGGETDTRVFALLRSLADVIVVGAGTARDEGYADFGVDGQCEPQGLSPVPTMVLVSRSLGILRRCSGRESPS